MDVTTQNLGSLFMGLKGDFLGALKDVQPPESVSEFVMETPSTTGTELYPTAVMIGDLERMLDELSFAKVAGFLQSVENETFAKGLEIPRNHIADDQLGMYPMVVRSLARKTGTFPYRGIPQLFIQGLTTAWIDGAMVWSNNHAWANGQAWDNYDDAPLTVADFERVCTNLMNRVDMDGNSMDLTPTHLTVGPSQWFRAKRLIERGLIAGSDNIHYESVKVVKWGGFRGAAARYWAVSDLSDSEIKPVVIQNREGPEFTGCTSPTDECMHRHDRAEYKVRRRFGKAIVAPWLVQFVACTEDTTTTTG